MKAKALYFFNLITVLTIINCTGIQKKSDKFFIKKEVGKKYTDVIGKTGGFQVRTYYGKQITSKNLSSGSTIYLHVLDYKSSSSGCLGLFGSVKYSYKINIFKVKNNIINDWAYGLYQPKESYTKVFGIVFGHDIDIIYEKIVNDYHRLVKTSNNKSVTSWK